MSQPTARKFSLGDFMILVAAAALGLLLKRLDLMVLNPPPRNLLGHSLCLWLLETCPFLIPASLALIAMRLRRPRPVARRLFREPGLLACLAVVAMEVSSDVMSLAMQALRRFDLGSSDPFIRAFALDGVISWGRTVALVWAVMALTGVWRPQPSWIDRAGRAFGIFLIALWLAMYFMI